LGCGLRERGCCCLDPSAKKSRSRPKGVARFPAGEKRNAKPREGWARPWPSLPNGESPRTRRALAVMHGPRGPHSHSGCEASQAGSGKLNRFFRHAVERALHFPRDIGNPLPLFLLQIGSFNTEKGTIREISFPDRRAPFSSLLLFFPWRQRGPFSLQESLQNPLRYLPFPPYVLSLSFILRSSQAKS